MMIALDGATEFDFTDIYKLSKLKFLKLNELNPEYLPPLKTLKNLEHKFIF